MRDSKHSKILFIGEAPDEYDNALGKAYSGANGRIVNSIFQQCSTTFAFCLVQTVGCRPTEKDYRDTLVNRVPTKAEATLCKPRIDQLVESYHFSGVVYMGKNAENYRHVLKEQPGLFTKAITIQDPAAILKMEYKLYSIKKAARKIDTHVSSIIERGRNSIHRK